MENETQNENNSNNNQSNLTWKRRLDSRKVIHETFKDLNEELLTNLGDFKRFKSMEENKPNYKLTFIDVADLIIYTCDIVKIKLENNSNDYNEENVNNFTYGIYSPNSKRYIREDGFLKVIVNIILTNESGCKLSLTNTTKEVDSLIQTSINRIRIANLPPKHIVKFNNCIFDIKHKCEHNGLDHNNNEYDFINKVNYDLKSLDDINQEYLNIVKETYRLWSAGKEDNELLLRQLTLAAIEGDGRNKYFIMQSEGGDGKSTFQYILEIFAGVDNTKRINLSQFSDDNAINNISTSTKLILGDDLQSRYKVSNKAMTNLKSLVSGDIINVNVKFMPNKNVQTHALMLQNTNTELNFYENSPALQQRIVVYVWPHYDFRSNPITDYNLDALLGRKGFNQNKSFIEAILSYIMFNTEYFDKFTVTDQMKSNTDNMLAANDTINLFLEDLDEKDILNYPYIPTKPIYEYYKDWLKINNPGSSPMKNREFSQKLNKQLKEIGYEIVNQKRINKIEKYEFNSKLLMTINDLNPNNYIKSNFYNMMQTNEPTKILVNENLLFNDNDVSDITDILLNSEEFNKLNNYSLPLIQYCIEILSKNKLSLLANLESLDQMYLLSKDELIEKLNM